MFEPFAKKRCVLCGFESELISSSIRVCVNCLRDRPTEALKFVRNTRNRWRRSIDFPTSIPHGSKKCFLCINECEIPIGGMGYYGVLRNEDERLFPVTKSFKEAYLRWYLDLRRTASRCLCVPRKIIEVTTIWPCSSPVAIWIVFSVRT